MTSTQEWFDELELLVNELTTRDGKLRTHRPDEERQPELYASYSKIRAVYGQFPETADLDWFKRHRHITFSLGKVKTVTHTVVG